MQPHIHTHIHAYTLTLGGPAGLDRAEGAATCTRVSHDHNGGGGRLCPSAPALPDVGAPGLLAYGGLCMCI